MNEDFEKASSELLDRWGYGERDRADTEYREALKRIEELKVEVRVLREVLFSILKERF